MTSFTSIPVLSLAAARDASTKPRFLEDLRSALLNVGFCYLSDTGLPNELIQKVCEQTFAFFDEDALPLEEKERIEMKNEKSFLGWSRVSSCHFVYHSPMGVSNPSHMLIESHYDGMMWKSRRSVRCSTLSFIKHYKLQVKMLRSKHWVGNHYIHLGAQ